MTALPSFDEFVALKASLRGDASTPAPLDLSETRMAKVLAPHLTDAESLPLPVTGYRCHVAEEWLAAFGLPAEWKPRALVTQGVRASLGALLTYFCSAGLRVGLPGDVYPVYQGLASDAGLTASQYESLRSGSLEHLLSNPDAPDVLLVTEPFKPRGSHLHPAEIQAIAAWLRQAPHRRVVIDAVYTFDTVLSTATQMLLATEQAIVLHSLSKGWARPLHAGVALVPESDIEPLTPAFRALSVNRDALRIAQGLLQHDRGQPRRLARVLRAAEQELREALTSRGVSLRPPVGEAMQGQYLFLVDSPWTALLELGVLALPASVFGSDNAGLSVVSSLRFVRQSGTQTL